MSRKLFSVMVIGVFVFVFAGTSMADVWSNCAYGPSEGADCATQYQAIQSGNKALTTDHGMSQTGSAEMRGPMETGSMPDRDLSGFEQQIQNGNRILNSDQIDGTVPSENWNSWPHGRENIEAGG
jgi:hypothetical protein